jgi:glucosamine-6-phosphate deaminase
MRILVGTPEQAAAAAAAVVAAAVADGARVIGVATGSSPQPLYRALAAHRAQGLDFAHLRAFALDEYVGIGPGHPESYHTVIARDVTAPLGLDPDLVAVPPGATTDLDAGALAYERSIADAGGIDIQILGIGSNGHVGFNEPGSAPDSRTRVVDLAESTRRANARYFDGDFASVPTQAMTQGIATILGARRLILVATGGSKAHAIAAAIMGEETSELPASYLRSHADVTFVLDYDAAAELPSGLIEVIDTQEALVAGSL